MSASGGKATFTALDGPMAGQSFEVQYNPKEFKFDKSVTWGEHKDQGRDTNGLEFTKIPPASATMDLYFDTTNEGNSNVRDKWVNGLLVLTNADVKVEGEGASEKYRPPRLRFTWGSFTMEAVIESVNTTYLMFAPDGTPIRARVSVKLKEWNRAHYAAGSGGDFIPGTKLRLVSSSGGTANSIAQQYGVSTRDLLSANPDIDDPTDVAPGTQMVIPGN